MQAKTCEHGTTPRRKCIPCNTAWKVAWAKRNKDKVKEIGVTYQKNKAKKLADIIIDKFGIDTQARTKLANTIYKHYPN